MKVLIVDDEALVRRSLSRAFASKGHEVAEAADGALGLELWRSLAPDLVFLDVLMPGLSGPEVIREIGPDRSGKVILMSAFAGEHNVETAQQIGADLFIPKPFDDIFQILKMAEGLLK